MGMVVIVLFVVMLDGAIKYYMDTREEQFSWKRKCCTIRRCRNKGAMNSMGEDRPDVVRKLSVVVLLGVFVNWLELLFHRGNRLQKMGGSLLLGGSSSNVLDRLTRHYVVDYIHIDKPWIRKIIFNISDVCIFLGGLLYLLGELFGSKRR